MTKIDVDVMGDLYEETIASMSVGDFACLNGFLSILERKDDEGNNKRLLRVQWDTYSKPAIIKGNGTLPDPSVDKCGFNVLRLGGRTSLSKAEKDEGLVNPKLRESNGNKYCYFSVGYNTGKKEDKPYYFDVGVFGASAEKFVCKYLKEGDNALVRGFLSVREEKFTMNKRKVMGLIIRTSFFGGVQLVTPVPKGGSTGSSGPSREAYGEAGGADEDLPY